MFLVATGIPMRKSALANMPLALAEPEPFTFAKRITKSLYFILILRMTPTEECARLNAAYPRH